MEFKRHFEVKRTENKDVDIAGEEETQKLRIVTLEKGNKMKITLKGEQDNLLGFRTGDNVEVKITSTQTELFTSEENKVEVELFDA